jgi:hypothetical protein
MNSTQLQSTQQAVQQSATPSASFVVDAFVMEAANTSFIDAGARGTCMSQLETIGLTVMGGRVSQLAAVKTAAPTYFCQIALRVRRCSMRIQDLALVALL